MNNIVTSDLSRFGYKELAEAGDLLKAYAENGVDFLGDGLTLNFNINSGKVFLSDDDANVGVLEDGKVVQFYSCPECGNEATQSEALENKWNFVQYDGYCSKACFNKNK